MAMACVWGMTICLSKHCQRGECVGNLFEYSHYFCNSFGVEITHSIYKSRENGAGNMGAI